jgi:hypothetical protein
MKRNATMVIQLSPDFQWLLGAAASPVIVVPNTSATAVIDFWAI